jgi:hypothetical protein
MTWRAPSALTRCWLAGTAVAMTWAPRSEPRVPLSAGWEAVGVSRRHCHDARKDHQNFFFDHEAYVREMGAQLEVCQAGLGQAGLDWRLA